MTFAANLRLVSWRVVARASAASCELCPSKSRDGLSWHTSQTSSAELSFLKRSSSLSRSIYLFLTGPGGRTISSDQQIGRLMIRHLPMSSSMGSPLGPQLFCFPGSPNRIWRRQTASRQVLGKLSTRRFGFDPLNIGSHLPRSALELCSMVASRSTRSARSAPPIGPYRCLARRYP